MNKERIKGAAQRLKGKIETTIGKLTGNTRLKADGQVDKVVGSARSSLGKAQEAVKEAAKDQTK